MAYEVELVEHMGVGVGEDVEVREKVVGGVEEEVGGVEKEDEEVFREYMEEQARNEEEYVKRCRDEED
ncbi:hypothetical protein Tco_0224148 [Tanacetum coccineum]